MFSNLDKNASEIINVKRIDFLYGHHGAQILFSFLDANHMPALKLISKVCIKMQLLNLSWQCRTAKQAGWWGGGEISETLYERRGRC